jgi:predicted DNA-binding protein
LAAIAVPWSCPAIQQDQAFYQEPLAIPSRTDYHETSFINSRIRAMSVKENTSTIGFFLPDWVKEGLRTQAERESRTMSNLLIYIIKAYLEEQEEVRALKARKQAERAA